MSEKKQGKVFVVTSVHGGVGKTTSSAAVAYDF
ncbi:septum site-determining protein MinD, partial [Francisella tularensis subsp. holarctica]|nr:septum site-determining protein MinD [Francisella tularensis subsp. holarctica]